jgi:release factor glutamine methyltransferase
MTETWTVGRMLQWTAGYFRRKGLPEPRLEAEILLAHVLGWERMSLYVNYDQPVNKEERASYRQIIKRRIQGEPVAYLVGYKEFFSLKFKVTSDVLIPRPDTEVLVETAIEQGRNQVGLLEVADVGTGSGVIAVTLAAYLPQAQIYAVDISERALLVAMENAALHGVADCITFMPGDLLQPLVNANTRLDMVVANLPYVPAAELSRLDPGVRVFEPRLALDGGNDGLAYYRRLIPQAYGSLKAGGWLLIEIGYDQASQVMQLLNDFQEVRVIPDLAGRERVVAARKESL